MTETAAASRAPDLRRLLAGDLAFHGPPGKHARHLWHPFPAKFPPRLPRHFIEGLSDPGDTVLDPMSGSGTALVEAQRLGRAAIGCDIDPLARLVASAKLDSVDRAMLAALGGEALREASSLLRDRRAALEAQLERRFAPKTRAFLDYWFRREQQLELLALRKPIERIGDESARRFLEVVLSSTIIAKSGGVSLARDLAHTRPHRVAGKVPESALRAFEQHLGRNLGGPVPGRLGETPVPKLSDAAGASRVLDASADRTGLRSESVDLVVTSPPYANGAIDYMRAHKFSLVWLGWQIPDLTRLRQRYLGHDTPGNRRFAPLPDAAEATLAALAQRDGRKAAVLRRYFGEMRAVLGEMLRVLRPGKAAVVVVGSSVLRGLDVRTHENLAAIGEAEGFRFVGMGVRELDRDRRMMPARWGRSSPTGIERRMHREHVIGFVKP